MKKGHLLLIIIALLILIMVGIFIGINNMNSEQPLDTPTVSKDAKLKVVTDRNNYYMVENCVNKFYTYYAAIYENKNPEEEDVQKTYNLLNKKYISFKNITEENLPTVLPKINNSVVSVYDMYVSNQSENISVYIVKGILREESTNKLSDFQIMVQIDLVNETFSVLLQDYIQNKYPNLNLEGNIKLELEDKIEKNRNNAYVFEEISDATYVKNLFERYAEEALYNPELAFEHLDVEYKSVKFETLESFKKYAQSKLEKDTRVERYLVTEEENYKQYVCLDNNEYYYIFRETGLMKYTIILDAYTIDLPEFLEKYNAASTVERVGYNIQKVLEAINNKDYAYVYDKLDFEFKAVNYTTLDNFEKVIKAKLFDKNEVVYAKSANEGSTYAYQLTIGDMKNTENKQDMTIVMQLKEGTDFVMSFSFSK